MSEKFIIHAHIHDEDMPCNASEAQELLQEAGLDLHYSYYEHSDYYIVEYTDES